MKFYIGEDDKQKLMKPEEISTVSLWKDQAQYNHKYEITISKIKRVHKPRIREQLRNKWNAFVKLFIL